MGIIRSNSTGASMQSIFLLVVVLTATISACQTAEPTMEASPLPTATRVLADDEIIERYLNCEDCLDGELDAVVELGEKASPLLFESLVSGPSPDTLRSVESGLRESYNQMVEYAKIQNDRTLQPRQSQDEFVRTFLENLVIQYQTRSVRAIALIGDEETVEKSRGLLEIQLARTEREDLRAMLLLAFGELK